MAHLPGTIETVRDDIIRAGGSASSAICDVRDTARIKAVIDGVVAAHGRLDAVIYNAGAIWWGKFEETPLKRYELMEQVKYRVNIRGLYAAITAALPHFRSQQEDGRFLVVSPPIYSRFFRGKTPYAITKVGMSVLTIGLGMDLQGSPIAITSLWPATAVQAAVTDVRKVDPGYLRKPEVFADAVSGILSEPPEKVVVIHSVRRQHS
ncbi:hypothetical protein HDU96_006662 [Phlyctochytrium bullatum]|nr:hypothetical protein HDU96_006662 [Phlyctochytrium bullatum]